jgi:YD repeat-containing protein
MKCSTSFPAGLSVRSALSLIVALAAISVFSTAIAQPIPCETWNSQVPQVPSGTTPELTYGVRKPGEGGVPFYRWERLDGTPPTDPLGQHDFLPTCWWSLALGWGAGDVLDPPVKLGFTDPQTGSAVRLPDGFAININPLCSPSIGDYLPAAPTVGLSALPLLPPGASGVPTGWQGSTRPVLEGAADLVTGLPLTQVTDLELPMDGATFRLTRTRSAILSELDRLSSGRAARDGTDDQPSAMGRWWDWLGVGWMVSENPVLLIDSALPDIVGPNARTCYLALDAHHSIPFQQVNLAVGTDGRPRVGYEAPPRFRARMTHNGLWGIPDGQGGYTAGWETPPTQYEIWLYDGTVKYTYVAIREDVPPNIWNENYSQPNTPYPDPNPDLRLSNYHDTPLYGSAAVTWDPDQYNHERHPGFGIPHYGICVRMEDRFGHVVEIEYCNVTRESIDDPDTEGCTECQQLCLRKGQIRHIKLKTVAGSQETVHWTLLYVHRLFPGDRIDTAYPETSTNSETASFRGMSAIDRIYVYAGDVFEAHPGLEDACLAIPSSDHPYRPGAIDPAVQWSLPTDWVHQVRYFYPPQNWSWTGALDPSATEMAKSPVVVMTQVDTRRQNSAGAGLPGTETHRYSFYRYSGWVNARSSRQQSWLERVYTAEDYERMLAWADEHKNDQGDYEATARHDLAQFLLQPALKFAFADISVDFPREGNLPSLAMGWLEGMASVRVKPWGSQLGWPTSGTSEFPSAGFMLNGSHEYLRDVPADRLVAGFGQSTVRTLSARTPRGELHHYRVFHLLAIPHGPTVELPTGQPFHINGLSYSGANLDILQSRPLRSLFYHPYRWFSAPRYGDFPAWPPNAEDWTSAADMSEVRWVRVIDEFASASDRDSTASYADDDRAIKPGQLSRRVVSMNAAGYILTDRTWEFRGQDVLAVGGGLGETYKYKSAQQYFADIGTPLPAPPTNGGEDPVASVRNEALLVQHRSVGWSAVAPSQQQSDGLVRDFEYDFYDGGLEPTVVPWQSRIRLIAESVRKGTAGTKLYTKRLFYSTDQPTDLVAEVIPLSSEVAGTRPDSIPEYPSDPSVAFPYSVTRWVSVRPEPQTTPTPPRNEWPVSRVINISPPRQVEPGSGWYYPVQMQVYDTQTGLAPWTAAGLVRNPESPTSGTADDHESLILAYTTYDGWGRPIAEVADALPGSTAQSPHGTAYNVDVPNNDLPSGWGRIGATDALNWVTRREYDSYGPTDIYLHNGRRWARRTVILQSLPEDGSGNPADYREEPDDPDTLDTEPSWGTWTPRAAGLPAVRRDFVFNDLESTTAGWVARSPGQVLDYARAAPADQIFRPIDGSTLVVEWLNARENSAWQQATGSNENFYIAYSRLDRLVRQPGPPLRPIRTRKVFYVQQGGGDALIQGTGGSGPNFLDGVSQPTQPHFRRIADVKYQPDQYGRLTDASLFERNADGIMAPIGMKQVNDLGEVYREREMDGTITRLVKNSLGQVLRRYIGTRDDAWLTVTGENAVLPFSSEDESDNNLVLVERTEYGNEPANAWLPTLVRRYTTNTGFSGDWHLHPYAPPPSTDPHGQATRVSYDWRMRPVRIDRFAQGEPADSGRLTTTLTFFDHAGRERLVVTYGRGTLPTLGTDRDPSLRSPTQTPEIPTPSQFLQANELRPLSITETTYGPDGGMTASLAYDVAWTGGGQPPYQAVYQFSGFGGVTVFRQGPGDEAERTVVDSLARVTSTATVIPTSASGSVQYVYEVARTDYTYDVDSNAVRTDRWERVVDSGSAANTLGTANAVWSSTVNWYDVQKRLVATAEVGTGQSAFVCAGADPATPSWYSGSSRPSIDAVAGSVNRQGVPADIPLIVNRFNRKGELEHIAGQQSVANGQAVYSFTRNLYTGFGQIARTIENPFGPLAEQRTTSYYYRFGRLAEVHADQQGTITAKQQTKTLFGANPENNWGADVIDVGLPEETTRLASRSGSLPRSMHLPDGSGAPDPAASVTLRYDFFGRLAERIDARGVVIRYTHDELDRLVAIEVGHYETDGSQTTFSQKHPESLLLPNTDTPVDRVGYVQFVFAEDHRTVDAYAYDIRDGNLIAHTRMEYDARGNLYKDWQGIGALLGPFSPHVKYEWSVQYASTSTGRAGRTRLSSMTYPVPPSVGSAFARVVTLGYGGTGTSGDVLSRVASITSTPTYGGDPSSVAAFTYVGTGRRARADIAGGAIVADLGLDTDPTGDNTIGLSGLDRFGRLSNLLYRQGSPSGPQTILTQLQYTYDLAGNRVSCTRTPRPIGIDPATRQEQANAYDILDRLVSSGYTNYNASNNPSLLLTHNWTLDTVGNWNSLQTILPGSVDTLAFDVDTRNKYTKISPSGSSQPAVDPLYDASGNLVFDGVHAFQYDGFGRVVQVNRASLPANAPPEIASLVVGPMVKHYTYDAFGRLIRVQSPFPDPESGGDLGLRVERLYYDGLRRIQEVNIDPSVSMNMAMSGQAGGAMQAAANQVAMNAEEPLDGSAAPATLESQALESEVIPATVTYLAREYVWGNGDWGVDELLAQYDADRRASWPLQDAGGDVIALCDRGGANGTARVITQIVYDAHGSVIDRDDPYGLAASAGKELRVGHKGLFFDRLDAGISDPATGQETPRLWPGARLSGYARNRTLHCGFGRWSQPDPNMTGLPVQAALVYHGRGLKAGVQGFDLHGHFGDGVNTYAYLGNAPWTRSDPQGLESLPSLMANMAGRAMIGGMTTTLVVMLFHDSGNDRISGRDMAITFGVGAGAEVLIGGLGIGARYMASRMGAAGEIGAGGRMLADDVVLQGSGLQGGRFAGSQSGMVGGSVEIAGQRLEYLIQYTWSGRTLKLEPALYPVGNAPAQIGVVEMRALTRQLQAEGYESGAAEVVISFQRRGSTGGPSGRPVTWPSSR